MSEPDPYKTLGVSRTASDSEIKRAYRKLAREFHPDVNPGEEAERRFKDINEAYDVLKDPEKRAEFDSAGRPRSEASQSSDWAGGFAFSDHAGRRGDPFADIFEAFGRRGPDPTAQRHGMFTADQHVRLSISLEDAVKGATREIALQQPSIDANGNVVLQDRRVVVTVPKGVASGQFLRLPGQGLLAQEGAQPGDLFVEIVLQPHPVFRIDGSDLLMDLPVTPWEAALGTTLMLPTPAGPINLKVPANARSGQKLRLKERGLPTSPPGHLYVVLQIVNPEAKTTEAKAFFEQMAGTFDFDPRADIHR
ncbi:DnaJ C-terminal domain-containing protein [Pseudaestuariivita atlantica]|uniref:DnaJ C-terminal domain-containing protein n=1 Tax=Pseudaestuariivita atlantica TaxID=1317121 RepID=UPI0009E3F2E8|nr:DnaJ C-terminal domain-containing protein [Pseudaestuariivita atlantica]